jgi:hypothetical protein
MSQRSDTGSSVTDWTPSLDDVQDALAFMRERLTGPLAEQCERRLRHIGDKIKAGEALTMSDNFSVAWWLPPVTQKRIDPRLAPSPHFWAFPRRSRGQ